MSYIPSVKKRDGRISSFRQVKVINSIHRACRVLGSRDKKLARDLARQVEDFLKQNYLEGETLLTDNIARAIEAVTRQTDHDSVGRLYSSHRRSKLAAVRKIKVVKSRKGKADSTDLSLMVVAESLSELHPWDRQKIIAFLTEGLEPPAASPMTWKCASLTPTWIRLLPPSSGNWWITNS